MTNKFAEYAYSSGTLVCCGDMFYIGEAIPDKSIDMILSDLPYGMTANNKWDSPLDLDDVWRLYNRIIKDNGAVVLTAAQPFASKLILSNLKNYKYEWIWQKTQCTGFLNAKHQPLREHEHILVFYKKKPVYNPQMKQGKPYVTKHGGPSDNYNLRKAAYTSMSKGSRYPTTILRFKKDIDRLHPTQKPISMFEYLIRTYTNLNDVVFDGCAGVGTTALAALRCGRKCISIEAVEKYFNISIDRLKSDKVSFCIKQ